MNIKKFIKNKKSFYSLIILTILFLISCFAEFIANDRPIIVKYKSKYYFPIFKNYTEKTFDGNSEIGAEYKNKKLIKKISQHGFALWPIIKFNYKSVSYNIDSCPSPPSKKHILGTDIFCRDILARLIYGYRTALLFSLSLTICTYIIGTTVGVLQGFFGGIIDLITQRIVEVWHSLPSFIIIIVVSQFMQPTYFVIFIIMMAFKWTTFIRFTRTETIKIKNMQYVQIAKTIGVSNFNIIKRHILPNAIINTISYIPFKIISFILILASLNFLNIGISSEMPSLGDLLSQGKDNLENTWIIISGSLSIMMILLLLVFIGEGMRDAYDVHK